MALAWEGMNKQVHCIGLWNVWRNRYIEERIKQLLFSNIDAQHKYNKQLRMNDRQLKVKCKNQRTSLVIYQEILYLAGKSQKLTSPTKASMLFQVNQEHGLENLEL